MKGITLTVHHTSRIQATLLALRLIAAMTQGELRRAEGRAA